jgi:hypothetical protein
MPKMEQHGREQHNLIIDDATRNKVRNAIQRRAIDDAVHYKGGFGSPFFS